MSILTIIVYIYIYIYMCVHRVNSKHDDSFIGVTLEVN